MKTSILTTLFLSTLLTINSGIKAEEPKMATPISPMAVELNLGGFCDYLTNGNPRQIEGIYSTKDGRYIIGIIKNETKTHDYIGVVINADNPYWKIGEVKFNLCESAEGSIEGYYYDSNKKSHLISFNLENGILKSPLMEKVDLEQFRTGLIALL